MRMVTLGVTAAAAAVLVAVAGCAPLPSGSPTPSPTPILTSSPTPTPTLSSEQVRASEAVANLYDVQNQVATNQEVKLDSFYTVAAGALVQDRLKEYQQLRAAGVRQVGAAVPTVTAVRPEAAPFEVDACVDLTNFDLVGKDGKSIVGQESPRRVLHRFTVAATPAGLKVTQDAVVATSC